MSDEQPITLYVDTREGAAAATLPPDVVAALRAVATSPELLEKGFELSALVLVRLGREAGELLLRHWMAHDPMLILNADSRLAETLAKEPEILTGALAGSPGAEPL